MQESLAAPRLPFGLAGLVQVHGTTTTIRGATMRALTIAAAAAKEHKTDDDDSRFDLFKPNM